MEKSQKSQVLSHLKHHGPLTPLRALGVYGIYRLAARVYELKQEGHNIETLIHSDPKGKTYAEYRLLPEVL
jgi:hypothetical protein